MVQIDDSRRLLMIADLLERLPTAVAYLTGRRHTFEFANEAYRRLVGGRELVGLPVEEALPEIVGQGYFEMLDAVRRTGQRQEGRAAEVWVQGDDGGLRQAFLDFLYEPVRDRQGEVTGILVHASDVTDHVRDRQRLELLTDELTQAHERYRTLFMTMLDGVVYHAADGAIVAANPAAAAMLGLDVDDLIGLRPQGPNWQAVREDGSPFPGDEHPATVALQTGRVVRDVVLGVRHGRTGERRWLSVTAIPDERDDQGRPQRAYAMFKDITEERRAATALRDRDSLLGRLRDANVLGIVEADEEHVRDANKAFLDMVGYTEEDLAAGRIDWRAITPPEWAPSDQKALEQLRRTGACEPFEKEFVDASGRRVPVMLGAAVFAEEPLCWVTFIADLSERQRAERERVSLVAKAQAARAEAESAEERLRLLLGAGALVAATRDRDEVLAHVTRLVVPALADFAAVFLPVEDGSLRAAAAAHRDPALDSRMTVIYSRSVPADSVVSLQRAFRSGVSELLVDLAGRPEDRPQPDPFFADLTARLRTDSAIMVPLVQTGQTLGVLTLGRMEGREPFEESDLVVAEELGRRLAVGLANVDVFAREHTVAEMLQRSVLPDALPTVPGLDLAVVYLPATEAVDVGGDWYDAFPLGGTRVGIVLGDVVGHNLVSASIMSQVRNALRAYAVDDDADPAEVLRRTNCALARLLPDAMATAFYGVLDPATGELTYTNAGHPPPLVSTKAGPRFLTAASGLMLGVGDDTVYEVATHRLSPGTALLLYSDGLVEDRGRSIDDGLATLSDAFSDGVPATAGEMCAAAQAKLLDPSARQDDVCLLAVRVPG